MGDSTIIDEVDSSSLSEADAPLTNFEDIQENGNHNVEDSGSITFLEKNYSKLNRNQKYKQKKRSSTRFIPVVPQFYIDSTVQTLSSDDESTFAGRRDMTNPQTCQETRIISSKGTVRGYKNRVRAGICTFIKGQQSEEWNYVQSEKGKIVVYMTSMRIVRRTHERCRTVQKILQAHLVRFEEKDLFMSKDVQKELMERTGKKDLVIPQIFVDGLHIGSSETLEMLNENGELKEILKKFEKIHINKSCKKCGGYQYVPCSVCHGSKRSIHRNHFTEEFAELRCIFCDDNGLLKCDNCDS